MITKLMELELMISGLRQENSVLRDILNDKNRQIDKLRFENQHQQRLADLEKRVANLEQGKQLFLLDDNCRPIKSFTLTGKLTLMDKTTEEKLEVDKWYHTTDFTQEELTELLPKGTTILVEREVLYDNIEKEPPTKTTKGKVLEITEGFYHGSPLINIGSLFNKEWFKIIKEN